MDFTDGAREAVVAVQRFKYGRTIWTETGATPVLK